MVWRVLSALFSVMALALFAAAVWLYFQPLPGEQQRLVVEEPERRLDAVVGGQAHDVEFRIHNSSDRTLRVVGAEYS